MQNEQGDAAGGVWGLGGLTWCWKVKLHQHRPQTAFLTFSQAWLFWFQIMSLPKIRGRQSKTLLQTIISMDPCAMNLEGNQRETSIQISELESMTTQDPVEGRQRETNLEIIMKLNPVEGRQRETGVETSLEIMRELDPVSSKRETKGDTHWEKPRNRDEIGWNWIH